VLIVWSGIYSLSVLDQQTDGDPTVKHYRIRKLETGGCYISARKRCDDVEQLIEHYSRNHI